MDDSIGQNITSVLKGFRKKLVKYDSSTELPGKREISHQLLWWRTFHFHWWEDHSLCLKKNRLIYAKKHVSKSRVISMSPLTQNSAKFLNTPRKGVLGVLKSIKLSVLSLSWNSSYKHNFCSLWCSNCSVMGWGFWNVFVRCQHTLSILQSKSFFRFWFFLLDFISLRLYLFEIWTHIFISYCVWIFVKNSPIFFQGMAV